MGGAHGNTGLSANASSGGCAISLQGVVKRYGSIIAQGTPSELVKLDMRARQFGMMFPGERQYFVRGLPNS